MLIFIVLPSVRFPGHVATLSKHLHNKLRGATKSINVRVAMFVLIDWALMSQINCEYSGTRCRVGVCITLLASVSFKVRWKYDT